MFKVGNFPKDYDLSLLNTMYHYPSKQSDGKYSNDAIDLIIKDNKTGDKFLETIENPVYDYFMIKDLENENYNRFFIEQEKTERITVPFRNLLYDIAERTDNMEFFKENIFNGNRYNNTRLHTVPKVMMSDSDIEDHYRWKFGNMYKNEMGYISKGYFDIEADTINAKGDFVEPGECPINAVTLIDDRTCIAHTFLLRNSKNPLIEEFEKSVGIDLYIELKDFVIDAVGGNDKAKKYKVDLLNFQFHFYDEDKEIDLIRELFNYINNIKPDFVLAWNMAFDIPYIIQRIKNLGYKPEDIMCHPDFKFKVANYFIDERNKDSFEERGDKANISSYSVFLDQLIHFASRRKGKSAIANFRLDYIGEITCGVKKLDYKHITTSLAKLPYIDYKTFVFYNIMDVIVQYCIENKVNDIGNVYNNVLLNNTRYNKIYRQSIYLHNRAIKSFYNAGLIMGNNCNKDTPKTPFPGAFVSDPKLNNNYSKMTLNGKPVMIFNNLDDFDYKSLYPSITCEFNMAPNTIIAHLNIPEIVYQFENRFNREAKAYRREGQFMEDLQSHVWLEFFTRWFNFASYGEMYDDVIEYYTREANAYGKLNIHLSNGKIPLFEKVPYKNNKKKAFIKINSEMDNKLYNGEKNIEIPAFKFDDKFKSFNDIYEYYQVNQLKRSIK